MEQMTLFQPQSIPTECNPLHAVVISDVAEIVIDNHGSSGVVIDENAGFILVCWDYGQFCLRRNRISLNRAGILDFRSRR